MKAKVAIGLIVLAGVAFLFSSFGRQRPLREMPDVAPDFVLPTLDGETLRLADSKGKVIILNFWSTRCPPCKGEIPDFVKLYSKYKNKGLAVIGVSLDRGSLERVKNFCEGMEITYPIVMGNAEVTQSYGGIMYIPTTFLIDHNSNIVKRYIGYTSHEIFEADIKQLLGNRGGAML